MMMMMVIIISIIVSIIRYYQHLCFFVSLRSLRIMTIAFLLGVRNPICRN